MNPGYRIIKNFERPLKETVEKFRTVPVTTISDAMNRTASVNSTIRPVNHVRLTGTAYTVRCQAGDNLMLYYAIDNALPGDVIVLDGAGYTERAVTGELIIKSAKNRGIAGFVIDGVVRDWEEISQMSDFAVFCKGTNPNGSYKNGPGEINVPVVIGGRVIRPGDIIAGDINGLVVVPREDAETVLQRTEAIAAKEERTMKLLDNGGTLDVSWMYRKLEAEGCEIIE